MYFNPMRTRQSTSKLISKYISKRHIKNKILYNIMMSKYEFKMLEILKAF